MSSSSKKLAQRVAASLLLIAFYFGVIRDLVERYLPAFKEGARLPESLLGIGLIAVSFFTVSLAYIWCPQVFLPIHRLRARLGWLRWPLAIAVAYFPAWLFLYTRWSMIFTGPYLRGLILIFTTAFIAWLVENDLNYPLSMKSLYLSGILFGVVFLLARSMQDVVSYPLSLSWSEGNRIWDYSIMYGRRLYNYPADMGIPAYIDRGRQSLWGLPFLLPNVSILGFRFWDAFLFTIPYALLGWFTFPREKGQMGRWFFAGLWAMLFLNQGPIYTPLVLAAILVAGSRRMPLWLAFPLVFLAGYYTNLTRITWVFAPAIWSGVIALMGISPQKTQTTLQRWMRAISLGIAGLLGGYLLPIFIQWVQKLGSHAQAAGGALAPTAIAANIGRQPLLWERLWPNTTYSPGIVLGLLIATGPLLVLLIVFSLRGRWRMDFWQAAALLGSLLAFLVVGLIVSVKIGGGSNLHNLDMFLIGLLFTTALAGEVGLTGWLFDPGRATWWKHVLVAAIIFIPASAGMMEAQPRNLPGPDKVEKAIMAVKSIVAEKSPLGDILFIDQRQLLTFGVVPKIPLLPEYEKKRMMDEAMADNAAYFKPFISDLASHRFQAIISEPLWIDIQGDTRAFSNENNYFVKWVSTPVLCYYEPVETFLDVGVQILVPRQTMLEEPNITCPIPSK